MLQWAETCSICYTSIALCWACHAIAAFKTEYVVKRHKVGPMAGGSGLLDSIATKMCIEMKTEI
jgi:hypothetical protein